MLRANMDYGPYEEVKWRTFPSTEVFGGPGQYKTVHIVRHRT